MTVEAGAGAPRQRAARTALTLPSRAAIRDRAVALARTSWQEAALLGVALVAIVAMRGSFASWVSSDYTTFLSQWFAFLQQHGFAGLGQEFADYNVPYLYLLWVGTLTPIPSLEWVKLLSAAADLSLAIGSLVLLRRIGAPRFVAAGASVVLLLLPEVLLNSAVWGQADSLYTGLVVWALCFAVQRKDVGTWVLFAVALSFKLQALFVLPALALAFLVHRHRVRALGIAAVAFLLTYVPAIVAGRSIKSLMLIYLHQADQYHKLSDNAPSLYAWLPDWAFDAFKPTGTLFAVAVTAVVLAVLVRRFRDVPLTPRALLHVAALCTLLVPFLLPAMHERYFYAGGVLVFLLAVLERRLLVAALAVQLVAVQVYTPNLFAMSPVLPVALLSVVELAVIVVLARPFLLPASAPVAPAVPAR